MGLNHLRSGKFAANGASLAVQVMAHNIARWTARLGRGDGIVTTKTLRWRLFSLVVRLTSSARRITLHLPARWPWATEFSTVLARFRALPLLAWRSAAPIRRFGAGGSLGPSRPRGVRGTSPSHSGSRSATIHACRRPAIRPRSGIGPRATLRALGTRRRKVGVGPTGRPLGRRELVRQAAFAAKVH